jgi:hypothetical protein
MGGGTCHKMRYYISYIYMHLLHLSLATWPRAYKSGRIYGALPLLLRRSPQQSHVRQLQNASFQHSTDLIMADKKLTHKVGTWICAIELSPKQRVA